MSNNRKYIMPIMKLILAVAIFWAMCIVTLAKNVSTPYAFKAGNVISADIEIDTEKKKYGDIDGLICDKSNIPPARPTNLIVTVSGSTVSLSWDDNSNDETGFKIMRKRALKGNYSLIDITAENVTTYEDAVSGSGVCWYRVIATSDNGDSPGSNVVKVMVYN